MSWKHVQSWADKHPVPSMVLGGLATALVLALSGLLAWRLHGKDRAVKVRGLVALGTLMATMVQASGMWHFSATSCTCRWRTRSSCPVPGDPDPRLRPEGAGEGRGSRQLAHLRRDAVDPGPLLRRHVRQRLLRLPRRPVPPAGRGGHRRPVDVGPVRPVAQGPQAEGREEGKPLEKVRWRFTPREIGLRLGLASADGSIAVRPRRQPALRALPAGLGQTEDPQGAQRPGRRDPPDRGPRGEGQGPAPAARPAARRSQCPDERARRPGCGRRPGPARHRRGADRTRLAQTRAQEQTAETERLSELLANEREAATTAAEAAAAKIEELAESLAADQAAAASAAEQDRSELAEQLTRLRAELEAVRARTSEADLEIEK